MSWRRAAGGTVASPAHRVRHPPKRRAHTHLACGCWLCHRRVGSARCTALGTARLPDRSGLCRTARHRCVGLRSSSRHYPFIGIRARRRGRRSIRAVPSRSTPRDSRPNRRHPRRRAALAQLSRCALDLLVWHRFSSAVLDAAISVSVDSARVCERARRPADPGSASPLPASRPAVVTLIDDQFREPALPCAITSRLRLRPAVCTTLARTAWLCGWSAGVESFKAARTRAAEAAQILIARAEAAGSVALLGHGFMNILIAGRLRALGWKGPRFPPPRHWAFGVYVHKGKEET